MGYELSFIGLLISLVFIGLTGVFPGGIIVPSYLVFFINQPSRIVGTLTGALLTYLCFKAVSQFVILFGKRRFVFIILTGGIWTLLWYQVFPAFVPVSIEFRVIGWVIPGLIANQFERQGVIITCASAITVTIAAYLLGQVWYSLF